MVGPDDPVFPVVRSRAPLIERVRERRQEDNDLPSQLGELVGQVVMSDSDVEKQQTANELREGVRMALAEELGVSESDIDETFIDDFTENITGLAEQDVLRQSKLEDLGIPAKGEEGEAEESEGTEAETDLFEQEEQSSE